MTSPRVLFIVKFKEKYDGSCGYDGTPGSFGGLYNSAMFVVQMLHAAGISAKLVQVCDNNDIDREVSRYKPTHVIVEALWVVPEKFSVLSGLHPRVTWIVRVHSEVPFLAMEGIAMEWIARYAQIHKVFVAANSMYAVRDFQSITAAEGLIHKILYLPNFYPVLTKQPPRKTPNGFVDIGCFGAIRPLKNQLIQALAAIEYSRDTGKRLRFHINTRAEQGGDAVLKNIRALFLATRHQLIEHPWESREDFLESVAQTDIGMQVSFSETFDITAADTVSLGIPLVCSSEVVWSSSLSQAADTNTASILAKLKQVTGLARPFISASNLRRLRSYCEESRETWVRLLRS